MVLSVAWQIHLSSFSTLLVDLFLSIVYFDSILLTAINCNECSLEKINPENHFVLKYNRKQCIFGY